MPFEKSTPKTLDSKGFEIHPGTRCFMKRHGLWEKVKTLSKGHSTAPQEALCPDCVWQLVSVNFFLSVILGSDVSKFEGIEVSRTQGVCVCEHLTKEVLHLKMQYQYMYTMTL